jgi:hypothetical protein
MQKMVVIPYPLLYRELYKRDMLSKQKSPMMSLESNYREAQHRMLR